MMQGTSGHDEAMAGLIGAACAWAVAGLFLWLWYNRSRFMRLLRDVPTVPIKGIFVGLTETRGTVEHDEPLTAGISGKACVWHQWSVSEHWRRTQLYKDPKGVTRTRIVTGSDVVASGGQWTDLRLRDDTGAIVVRAKGADWTPTSTFQRTVGMRDPLYRSKAPGVTVSGSTGQRTFSESAVPVGAVAWVSAAPPELPTTVRRKRGTETRILVQCVGARDGTEGSNDHDGDHDIKKTSVGEVQPSDVPLTFYARLAHPVSACRPPLASLSRWRCA
jgi:hypothetical protein